MELRHLRYFVVIAEEENFNRAAQRLFMSQSPLSRQMRDLQTELGLALFEPVGRGVKLTVAGRYFADRAKAILASVEAAAEGARQLAEGQVGTVRIGFETGTAYFGILASIVGAARRREPRITLELTPMSSAEQWEALHAGQIALGYGFYTPVDASLESTVVVHDRLGVVLAHDHPLASRNELTAANLHDQPVLLQPRHLYPRLHDDLIAAIRSRGVVLKVKSEITDLEALLALVASGDGLTFLPHRHVAILRLGSAVWKPLADVNVQVSDVVMWRAEDATSPLLRPLIDIVREVSEHPE
jgi:DNA-binding transcriptional LysR family regulator